METQNNDFEEVVKQASQQGFFIDIDSIKSLASTGFMSQVFIATMGDVDVVVNLIKEPVTEQLFQHVPQKIKHVASILTEIKQVPKVYATGTLSVGGYFILQEKKGGIPLGVRSYENQKFVDEILVEDSDKYVQQLQDIILRLHSHQADSFGYISFGQYEALQGVSWTDFLMKNAKRSVQILEDAEQNFGISYFIELGSSQLLSKLQRMLESFPELFSIQKSSLIHGDIFNYSNVLVDENSITAVLDFEWSLWGHPAWEFAFTAEPRFEFYLPQAIEKGILPQGIDFQKSIDLHTIFWCLWGASVHANNSEFGLALFQAMKVKLDLV
jgi:serine/threonine protein kinase